MDEIKEESKDKREKLKSGMRDILSGNSKKTVKDLLNEINVETPYIYLYDDVRALYMQIRERFVKQRIMTPVLEYFNSEKKMVEVADKYDISEFTLRNNIYKALKREYITLEQYDAMKQRKRRFRGGVKINLTARKIVEDLNKKEDERLAMTQENPEEKSDGI